MQTAQKIAGGHLLPLRLPSLRSLGWVEAQGRIVWQDQASNLAGIEFVDLAEEAQREVRTWLSFGSSLQELRGNWTADPAATDVPAYSDTYSDRDPLGVTSEQEQADLPLADTPPWEALSSTRSAADSDSGTNAFDQTLTNPPAQRSISPLAASAVAVLLILLAVVAGRHANPVRGVARWFSKKTVTVQDARSPGLAPGPASKLTEVPQSPALPPTPLPLQAETAKSSIPSLPSTSVKPEAGARFALQVAAMKEEENATQLVESLRSKNFPAFVSKRPGEHLYRVLVGPYPDNQSVYDAQNALQKEGIQPITKRWTP